MDAVTAYVSLFVADVRANPSHFKAFVVVDPEGAARRDCEGLNTKEIQRLTNELRAEIRSL